MAKQRKDSIATKVNGKPETIRGIAEIVNAQRAAQHAEAMTAYENALEAMSPEERKETKLKAPKLEKYTHDDATEGLDAFLTFFEQSHERGEEMGLNGYFSTQLKATEGGKEKIDPSAYKRADEQGIPKEQVDAVVRNADGTPVLTEAGVKPMIRLGSVVEKAVERFASTR